LHARPRARLSIRRISGVASCRDHGELTADGVAGLARLAVRLIFWRRRYTRADTQTFVPRWRETTCRRLRRTFNDACRMPRRAPLPRAGASFFQTQHSGGE